MFNPLFKPVKLMLMIADRARGKKISALLNAEGCYSQFAQLGRGTAPTELSAMLGLGDSEKVVFIVVAGADRCERVFERARQELGFGAGGGIGFTLPINSVSSLEVLKSFHQSAGTDDCTCHTRAPEAGKGEGCKMQPTGFSLIVTVVEKGFDEVVMQAAREAGAGGGTVMHARGTGSLDAEKIFGVTIEPEKELILILTADDARAAIMKAIYRDAGIGTAGRGICFALPVETLLGTNIAGADESPEGAPDKG